MKKAADKTTSPAITANPLTVGSVGLLFLDTSARLFVPSVGGTVLGLWADKTWGTTPWLTITGVLLGSALAFTMVYKQIQAVKKDRKEK